MYERVHCFRRLNVEIKITLSAIGRFLNSLIEIPFQIGFKVEISRERKKIETLQKRYGNRPLSIPENKSRKKLFGRVGVEEISKQSRFPFRLAWQKVTSIIEHYRLPAIGAYYFEHELLVKT
jgi:hypothetical protein